MGRILNAPTLLDHGHQSGRRMMLEILEAGLRAADPYYATLDTLRLEGEHLIIGGDLFAPAGSPLPNSVTVDLRQVKRIFVLGAGKGINGVAKAIEDVLGDRLSGGVVIEKHGTPHSLTRVEVVYGAHPIPDEGCARGCERILEIAADLGPDDLVLTSMGNGVGSLLTLPAAGVTMQDVRDVVYAFQIEKGGPTVDLIPIRNHLDRMKGGQFTRHLQRARVIQLIAFTRPNSYTQMITSPHYRWLHTLPDSSTFADAVDRMHKWEIWEGAPQSVLDCLTRAEPGNETLKADEFEQMQIPVFFIFPPELGMVPKARLKAEELGFKTHLLFNNVTMLVEASQLGKVVANLALTTERLGEPFTPPVALLSSGEMVVTVGKSKGMGGRNQEYSLAAALEIAGTQRIVMGSLDSDGTDGPGHQFLEGDDHADIPVLAGGIVDGESVARARAAGIDLAAALKSHDTSPALYHLGDGVVTTAAMSMTDLSVTLILGEEG
jgi:glycerate 2-kinase